MIVAPCTTKIRGIETEVVLDPEVDPVPKPSAASLDAVQDVSMVELVERLGRLSADRMRAICDALAVAVDCGG